MSYQVILILPRCLTIQSPAQGVNVESHTDSTSGQLVHTITWEGADELCWYVML